MVLYFEKEIFFWIFNWGFVFFKMSFVFDSDFNLNVEVIFIQLFFVMILIVFKGIIVNTNTLTLFFQVQISGVQVGVFFVRECYGGMGYKFIQDWRLWLGMVEFMQGNF